DQVLQNFPDGNKAATAELKKGMALLELGKQDDGVAALRHVVQRYPKTNEALQARERLRKLGVATVGSARRESQYSVILTCNPLQDETHDHEKSQVVRTSSKLLVVC